MLFFGEIKNYHVQVSVISRIKSVLFKVATVRAASVTYKEWWRGALFVIFWLVIITQPNVTLSGFDCRKSFMAKFSAKFNHAC